MNVYFELADCVVDPHYGKYIAVTNALHTAVSGTKFRALARNSERVWTEDELGVKIIKNRLGDLTTVDMPEFFVIKLKSFQI